MKFANPWVRLIQQRKCNYFSFSWNLKEGPDNRRLFLSPYVPFPSFFNIFLSFLIRKKKLEREGRTENIFMAIRMVVTSTFRDASPSFSGKNPYSETGRQRWAAENDDP